MAVSVATRVTEIILLSVATVFMVAVIIIASLANATSDPSNFGFSNNTGDVQRDGQYGPAPWAFSVIWPLIFVCQLIWITYGWSYTCRPRSPRSIHYSVYIAHIASSITGIIWLYVWGNGHDIVAYPIIILFALSLYVTLGIQAVYLYRMTPELTESNKFDLWFTRIVVLNCQAVYATWLTLANLLSIGGLINRFSEFGDVNTVTLIFSFLAGELILYLILENTILDRFLRWMWIVYPLVILALIGVVTNNWYNEHARSSSIFSLVLLIVAVLVLILRIALIAIFSRFRPIIPPKKYNSV